MNSTEEVHRSMHTMILSEHSKDDQVYQSFHKKDSQGFVHYVFIKLFVWYFMYTLFNYHHTFFLQLIY